jgi:hypothetical protein
MRGLTHVAKHEVARKKRERAEAKRARRQAKRALPKFKELKSDLENMIDE